MVYLDPLLLLKKNDSVIYVGNELNQLKISLRLNLLSSLINLVHEPNELNLSQVLLDLFC